MNRRIRSVLLVVVLFALPWLAASLIANIGTTSNAGPVGQSQPSLPPQGNGGVLVEPSLVQGPSYSELAVFGAALSVLGGFMILRAWKRRRKKDDFWYVESQKGSPLLSILMLGLAAVVFYGIFTLVKNAGTSFNGQGQAPSFPDLLPYLVVGAIATSSAIGAVLFLSLKRVPIAPSGRTLGGGVDEERISDVLSRAVHALRGGSDYRTTILNCYRAICEILSRDEETDSSKLTAREFEALVTSRVAVDRQNLHDATLLFEKARYSIDPVYDEDAKRAETCLRRLNDEVQHSGSKSIIGVRRLA
ncbi:MAG: DUF4129 domain-containing protein [Nitrososphaerota archaeon]|jgi:hypothetical protein|nr:DUF4129 domain-containing protein [Nitrososphaerota archaeon]MDG6912283.1 DUF4129 domain-containing protein [Nitrososphaerota archaeon]MDG6919678.1 DUF4129 domain-containing protein [Nitrososphaerota archaeon]MDG6920979.1 DUF4129 domain-containing protein [Nitrososphaerota archaeon]MDG6941243.1 DUF4129 domain-containing protein [Nitrososphaerota archaeon]